MKKIIAFLFVVTVTLSASAQIPSRFVGEWMGVITPNRNGITSDALWWDRTTVWFTVYDDGSVYGDQWDFEGTTKFDDFTGVLSERGRLLLLTEAGDTVTLSLSQSGKGSGVWKTPNPDFYSLVVRQTVTLYRRNPR